MSSTAGSTTTSTASSSPETMAGETGTTTAASSGADLNGGGGGHRWLTGDDDQDAAQSARQQAAEIQNVLICLEMLFFSIAHWCVFPVEEWEEGYTAKNYAKPGMGLKDFASDVHYIIRGQRKSRRGGEEEEEEMGTSLRGEGDEQDEDMEPGNLHNGRGQTSDASAVRRRGGRRHHDVLTISTRDDSENGSDGGLFGRIFWVII